MFIPFARRLGRVLHHRPYPGTPLTTIIVSLAYAHDARPAADAFIVAWEEGA